jgi:hypothetical protein
MLRYDRIWVIDDPELPGCAPGQPGKAGSDYRSGQEGLGRCRRNHEPTDTAFDGVVRLVSDHASAHLKASPIT